MREIDWEMESQKIFFIKSIVNLNFAEFIKQKACVRLWFKVFITVVGENVEWHNSEPILNSKPGKIANIQ